MWLEIFKTGTFTDNKGKKASFNADNIAEIVAKYNNEVSEKGYSAPLVKGHPLNDAPAYGWVERLARRGNVVLAKVKDLSDEIIEEVRQGKYKKVSIALSPDYLLRHIGLLGAAQPAVQGLQELNFDSLGDSLLFSLDLDSIEDNSKLIESMQIEIEKLKTENLKLRKIDISRTNREFAEAFFEKNSYLQKSDYAIEKIVSLLDCAEYPSDSSEYSENSGLRENLVQFFDALKPTSLFSPIKGAPSFNRNAVEFEGKNVVEDRLDIHNKAMAMLSSFPEMTYESAVNQIING